MNTLRVVGALTIITLAVSIIYIDLPFSDDNPPEISATIQTTEENIQIQVAEITNIEPPITLTATVTDTAGNTTDHEITINEINDFHIIETDISETETVTVQHNDSEIASKTITGEPTNDTPDINIPDMEIGQDQPFTITLDEHIETEQLTDISWDMDDGTIYTDEQEITHTYETIEEYNPTISVEHEPTGTVLVDEFTVTVTQPEPISQITIEHDGENIFTDELVTFNGDQSVTQTGEFRRWRIDGETYYEKNPELTFETPGSKPVILFVEDRSNNNEFIGESTSITVFDSPQ